MPIGEAIFFVCLIGVVVLLGACVAAYAAHSFFVVVQDTAAGNDEVTWPDEPYVDWFWQGFYLLWLGGLGVGLCWLAVRRTELATGDKVLAALAGGWLLFPISLLSSLSASSPWIALHWTALLQMARHPAAVALSYAISAVLLGGWAILVVLGLASPLWWLLILAGPVGAACLLIYARLLGRLALVVFREPQTEETDAASPDPSAAPSTQVAQPYQSAAAAESPPSTSIPVEGYEVQEAERTSLLPLLATPAPNGHDGEADLPVAGPQARPRKRKRVRIEPPPLPARPMLAGVYNFPWYAASLGSWLWLSFGLGVIGGLVRLLVLAKFW
jgi:hypothetical protein